LDEDGEEGVIRVHCYFEFVIRLQDELFGVLNVVPDAVIELHLTKSGPACSLSTHPPKTPRSVSG